MSSSNSENRSLVVPAIAIIVVLLGASGWMLVKRLGEPPRIRLSQSSTPADATITPTPSKSTPDGASLDRRSSHRGDGSDKPRPSRPPTPGPIEPVAAGESNESTGHIARDNQAMTANPSGAEERPIAPIAPRVDEPANDGTTYSTADRDVQPPSPLRPDLMDALNAARPGVRLNLLSISVVVNADGTVESVKGMNRPDNLGEFLLLTQALSVVKSWTFFPAMRNGVPVRYRQVVPVSESVRAPD